MEELDDAARAEQAEQAENSENADQVEKELATPAPGEGRRRAGRLRASSPSTDRRRLIVVALAVSSTALLILTVLFAVLWNNASGEQGDTDDVRRVAGDFAQRFLGIDTSDLDGWKDRVLDRSTGALRRDFEEGLETAVVQSILSLAESARVEVTIDELYVGHVDSRVARVIVEAETITLVRTEGTSESFPNRVFMALDLVKQDDGWLVDGLQHLNFQPGATATTGTTGPPATGP